MSSLAIIVIIVLLAAFIYMWAKCQSLQKEVHSKENKENELKSWLWFCRTSMLTSY